MRAPERCIAQEAAHLVGSRHELVENPGVVPDEGEECLGDDRLLLQLADGLRANPLHAVEVGHSLRCCLAQLEEDDSLGIGLDRALGPLPCGAAA